MFGIDNRGIDVGENPEVASDANVVPVARYAVADHAVAHLAILKWLDHLVFERHLTNPTIGLYRHPRASLWNSGAKARAARTRILTERALLDNTQLRV